MMIGMGLIWLAVVVGAVWLDEYRQRRDVLTGAAALRPASDAGMGKRGRSER